MPLFVIVGLQGLLDFPKKIFKYRIFKHQKRLEQTSNYNGNSDLNLQLKVIDRKINDDLIFIILSLIIAIIGILYTLQNFRLWYEIKIYVWGIFIVMILRFLLINRKLGKNIRDFESLCNY